VRNKLTNSFLGFVDLLGTTYSAPTLATGYGAHIAQPLLREAFEEKAGTDGKGPLLTAEEAEKVIADCMKVLFYRDARSINKVSFAMHLPVQRAKADVIVPNCYDHRRGYQDLGLEER
jgi:20S proteasome alpha/beta subunit